MAKLNLVLVEPQIPQNTGNVARTCAVTGAALHIVKPMGFEIDDKKLKRAGLDYWDKLDITYYNSLAQFLEINKDEQMYFFSTKAKIAHSDVVYPEKCFLVFGKETAGLPRELVADNMDRSVRIPMRDELRCLNLSNSVAIGAYEVLRQWDYPDLTNEPSVYL
jgi:tRNA (cytidine/uridine-2'-O-)-methyltransferase